MPPRANLNILYEAGQGLTEYLLIFSPLAAIIAMAVLTIVMSRSI
jgi:hypothetical protein